MAINAFYEMNVVRALGGFECRVHGFYVQAAVGELGMAGGARSSGLLAVSLMAGEAAESFMHAHRSAIVARCHVHRGQRRVALVAEGLANVRADFDSSVAVMHRGQRKISESHVIEFAAVEKRE